MMGIDVGTFRKNACHEFRKWYFILGILLIIVPIIVDLLFSGELIRGICVFFGLIGIIDIFSLLITRGEL